MSQMYLNKIIRQIKKYFLSIMYIIWKLIVKLDLKFLLSNRQQKFVNKTALMHACVLAAMSHFLSGPLRMRPSGVRGKTYPESVLTGGLSRCCRDIVAVIIESYPRRARVDFRKSCRDTARATLRVERLNRQGKKNCPDVVGVIQFSEGLLRRGLTL